MPETYTTHGLKMAAATTEDWDSLCQFFRDLEEKFEDYDVSDEDLGAWLRTKADSWGRFDVDWHRVVFGFRVLQDNCTDPDADTLEWRKDIAAFLASQPAPKA